MARPRVFISSTFHDLKHVREDVDRFVRELGYDGIRHEMGSIPYGSKEAPEKYAYAEVRLCDILVCIIGGRFGTESKDDSATSITQTELKHALESGIQVFLFIESPVYHEFQTYKLNKGNKEVKYRHVDDVRIFGFIEHVHALPHNNPIHHFVTSREIVAFLKEQWAGLFQRFLANQKRIEETNIIHSHPTGKRKSWTVWFKPVTRQG